MSHSYQPTSSPCSIEGRRSTNISTRSVRSVTPTQLVECPICTLYLRTGMSMEDHLDTHPKELLIQCVLKNHNILQGLSTPRSHSSRRSLSICSSPPEHLATPSICSSPESKQDEDIFPTPTIEHNSPLKTESLHMSRLHTPEPSEILPSDIQDLDEAEILSDSISGVQHVKHQCEDEEQADMVMIHEHGLTQHHKVGLHQDLDVIHSKDLQDQNELHSNVLQDPDEFNPDVVQDSDVLCEQDEMHSDVLQDSDELDNLDIGHSGNIQNDIQYNIENNTLPLCDVMQHEKPDSIQYNEDDADVVHDVKYCVDIQNDLNHDDVIPSDVRQDGVHNNREQDDTIQHELMEGMDAIIFGKHEVLQHREQLVYWSETHLDEEKSLYDESNDIENNGLDYHDIAPPSYGSGHASPTPSNDGHCIFTVSDSDVNVHNENLYMNTGSIAQDVETDMKMLEIWVVDENRPITWIKHDEITEVPSVGDWNNHFFNPPPNGLSKSHDLPYSDPPPADAPYCNQSQDPPYSIPFSSQSVEQVDYCEGGRLEVGCEMLVEDGYMDECEDIKLLTQDIKPNIKQRNVLVKKEKFLPVPPRRVRLKGPYECLTCGKMFPRRGNWRCHLRVHLNIRSCICDTCGKGFYTRQKLQEHERMHTGFAPIKCTMCPKQFRRYSNMIQHRYTHLPKKRQPKRELQCPHCEEVYHSQKRLEFHLETHSKKPHVCPHCGDRFVHIGNLTKHIRTSHDKEFIRGGTDPKGSLHVYCPQCKVMLLKTSLRAHLRKHTGEKPFPCDVCQRAFATKANLLNHKWVHTNRVNRPYKCNQCTMAFGRKLDLVAHERSHKGLHPYTCNECGQRFTRRPNWRRHVLEHSTEKRYSCVLCPKTFARSYNLKDHVRTHYGARPFSCHICGKTSATKSNHNAHLRVHHAREPVSAEG